MHSSLPFFAELNYLATYHAASIFIISAFVLAFDFLLNKRIKFGINPFKISLQNCLLYNVVALLLFLLMYLYDSPKKGGLFVATYGIEYLLSLDNLFVFMLAIRKFNIDKNYLLKLLPINIIATLFARWLFIVLGLELVERFYFVMVLFGGLLIYAGVKLIYDHIKNTGENEIGNDLVTRTVKVFFPVSNNHSSGKLIVREEGRLKITNNLLALVATIMADIICAMDSIPAAFAITNDRYIIYIANLMAIVGLRSLYIALETSLNKIKSVTWFLSIFLIGIGLKIVFDQLNLF